MTAPALRVVLITDEVAAGVEEGIEFARRHGIREIALRGVAEENVAALGGREIDALEATLRRAGVGVTAVLSPLFKAYLPGRAGPSLDDPNVPQFSVDGAEHLALRDRLPALAARLGAAHVRVFSFLTGAGAADARGDDDVRSHLRALELSRPGLYALENEDVCFVQTVEQLQRCTAESGLQAMLDPANDWYVTRAPVAPRITPALVARLADVHVKDMVGEECVPLGEGQVDWPAILDRLRELGYRGTLTHEPHIGRDRDGVARAVDALHRLLG
jgi:sugar phosphate isomerase/epimerase